MIKTWQQRYNEACLDPVAGERSSRELISEAKLAEIDELRAANARLWLEREEPHRTIQDYLYECNSLEQERDELLAKLAALEKQEPIAWIYAWECEGELITDWMTTDIAEAHSLSNECHNIRPLFLAAGAAPVQQMFGGRVDPSYVSGPMLEAAPAAKVPEEPRIDINDLSGMIAAVIKDQS